MPPGPKIIPRLALVVAGGVSVIFTVVFTVWLDRLGEQTKYAVFLISLVGSAVIPIVCLCAIVKIGQERFSATLVPGVLTAFLLFAMRMFTPDGIELYGETVRDVPVNETVNHPTAMAFTLRDAELRPELQGEGIVYGSRRRIKGKAYAVPVVPHGWNAGDPVHLWLFTSRTYRQDSLPVWPSQIVSVVRADFDGGTSAQLNAIANAIEKHDLHNAEKYTFVYADDDPEGRQAYAWTSFYAVLKVDAGIWLVASFFTLMVARGKWHRLRRQLAGQDNDRRYKVSASTIVSYIIAALIGMGLIYGGYAARRHEIFLLDWFLFAFGGLLILGVMIGLRNAFRNVRIRKEEDEAKGRLQEAKAEGYEMAYEHDEPLGPQDHKDLDRVLWKSFWLLMIPIVGFTVMAYFIIYFGIMVLVCFVALALAFRNVQRIRRANVKTVLRGFVTDRLVVRGRSRTKRSTTVTYFIQIGQRKFRVGAGMYNKFKPGNMAEIHFINRPPVKIFGQSTHGYMIISAKTVPFVGVTS